MNYPENVQKILDRIPEGWGLMRYIGVSEGWWPLIASLNESLAAIDPDYKVMQVKEKFGTLRYYIETDTLRDDPEKYEQMDQLIYEAENESSSTCEKCGDPGELRTDNWYRVTLCHDCHNKRKGKLDND